MPVMCDNGSDEESQKGVQSNVTYEEAGLAVFAAHGRERIGVVCFKILIGGSALK